MHSAVSVAAVGVLAIVAYGDVRARRIPNALCLAIAMLGLVRIASTRDAVAASYTLLAATAIFVITLLLFRRGIVGGGDAKLITAVALLIGHHNLLGFLFLMSLAGGVLAVLVLARDNLGPRLARSWSTISRRPFPAPGSAALGQSTVPYGLAIAAAGVFTLIAK